MKVFQMIKSIKKLFNKEPRFKLGQLVKTIYPLKHFPNLNVGMVKAQDLTHDEQLNFFIGKPRRNEEVYKILLGNQKIKIFSGYQLKKLNM